MPVPIPRLRATPALGWGEIGRWHRPSDHEALDFVAAVGTLGAEDAILLADRLACIPLVPGVLCAMRVYEHHEGEEEMRDGST